MLKTKRIVTLILTLTLIMTSFAVFKAPASAYDGSDYTNNPQIAAKLEKVLNGTAQIFNNTSETYAVGDSINNSFAYTWGDYNTWGYQCLAYARAVYYYLNGEDADYYSSDCFSRSYLALDPSDCVSELSYSVLSKAGVGCGAYVRTTGNSDYSYNTSNGHSFIILTYDENTMTFLEGNANYAGLIALNTYTWDEFNSWRLARSGRKVSFVIQPDSTSFSIPGDGSSGGSENVTEKEAPTEAPVLTTIPETTTRRPPVTDIGFRRPLTIPGDVNGNGKVDSGDARIALRTAVGLESFDDDASEWIMLDVNEDGVITSNDARMILRLSVGLE